MAAIRGWEGKGFTFSPGILPEDVYVPLKAVCHLEGIAILALDSIS